MQYGADPQTIKEPQRRALAEKAARAREDLASKIRSAVEKGKLVVSLQSGDPMMYGLTLLLEILPKDIFTEVVPGIGACQAASAAVKMSPPSSSQGPSRSQSPLFLVSDSGECPTLWLQRNVCSRVGQARYARKKYGSGN